MAFNLSARMGMRGGGRFSDGVGSGFRSNAADFNASAETGERGGYGAETHGDGTLSSNLPGNPHSSYGFRRAIREAGNKGNSVIGGIHKRNFSMGKNAKPSYFAQGGHRHGLHMGAGAPATMAADDGVGGE